MTEPSTSAADLVGGLWRDVRLRQEARAGATVPELGPTSRMIHDADLLYLASHRDPSLPELLEHLIPLLTTMAERRDELVNEVKLLREAIVAESDRLQERDDLLHRLLESRLEQLGRNEGESC